MSNTDQMEVAISAALAAGKILRQSYGDELLVQHKESRRDIFSNMDILAENIAINIIKKYFPDDTILAEENGLNGNLNLTKYWVVDALDGTVNFIHQVPFFGVSIAFVKDNIVQAGCIYMPLADDIYYSARNFGAYKNQKRIYVKNLEVDHCLFAVSFSGKNYEPQKRGEEYLAFGQVNDASSGCLRTGSAAVNLAYLAEGRFNGCWGKANKYWDVAAGLLLAEEAGASIKLKLVDYEKNCVSFVAAPPTPYNYLAEKLSKWLI